MNAYRHYCITRPETAAVRRDMVNLYRMFRRTSPAMARLLYRRQREATAELAERIFSDYAPDQRGGLQELLK
jgi:hypothetical protein